MPMMALSLIPQHAVPVKGFMMAKMGVVYVIRNDEHVANRFKVGQTYDLEKRISELSSETSNIGKFYTIAKFPVEDAEKAEKECHTALKHFRKAKEFFDGPEEEITLIVKRNCERYIPKAFMRTDLQHELDELKANSNITSENKIRIEEIEKKLKIEPKAPEVPVKISPFTETPEERVARILNPDTETATDRLKKYLASKTLKDLGKGALQVGAILGGGLAVKGVEILLFV
jgi:hypothetical protein